MNNKQAVLPGALLLKEKPFVFVLSSKYRTERCDFCFNTTESLSKCSACQYVYYCGKVCQKEGWTVHKHECRNLKRVAPRIVPDAARLLARLIHRLNNGGDVIRSYYTESSFRMFKNLMSHYTDMKDDKKRTEHFTSLYGVLCEYIGMDNLPNTAELLGIYGRMCINSFNISSQEMQPLGTGIYLAASVVDHSCNPNAVATFEGTTIYIRSLKKYKRLDFTQVFISYIDVLNTSRNRQDELQFSYYFKCKCDVCMDTKDLEVMTAAACTNSSCDGYVDMSNLSDVDKKCVKCGLNVEDGFIDAYEDVTELTEIHLQNMKEKNVAYLDVCKVCLKKQQGVLHKFNIQHVKTLDLAFESSIDFREWNDAKMFGFELLEGYRKYYGNLHPLLGLLNLKLGKILVFEGRDKEALTYLKEAFEILSITHGTSSSVFKELLPLFQQASMGC